MLKLRSLLLISLLACFPLVARAQVTSANNGTSTPIQGIGHDYIRLLGETVNPANGSVSLRLKVPVPSGRLLTLPFSFGYDSSVTYTPQGNGSGGAFMEPTGQYLLKDGWSYALPLGSSMMVSHTTVGFPTCYASTGYVFQDAAGARYSFGRLIGFARGPQTCTGDVDSTSDSSDFYSASIADFSSPLIVSSLDNTTYTFPVGGGGGCGASEDSSGSSLPSTIEDRNGNIVTVNSPTCNGSFTIKDTLNRTVISSSGFGTSGNTVAVSGLAQPYTVTWGTTSPTYTPGFTFDNPGDQWCSNTFAGPRGAQGVVTAITLPNGKRYTFSYDATYGLLSKITFPTGGYISYTWTLNSRSDFAAVTDANGAPQNCFYNYDTPAIAHRYVSFDGTTIAEQQDFSYTTTWKPSDYTVWTGKQTTVTTHDLVNGTSFQTVYTYSPVSVNTGSTWLPTRFGSQVPVEQSIVYKSTSGATLRTVNKTWYDQYEIKSEQTTLETGQSSQTNYTWTGGAISELDEYDFGQASPARKTLYTPNQVFPSSVKTYDQNGILTAETDTVYGTATTAVSNLPPGSHDESNFGPSSIAFRGNATQITKKCLQSCLDSVTTYTFDETGQATSMTDPNGNVTQYSFSDNFDSPPSYNTNAYLTTLTRPTTNGVAHISTIKYAFASGQRISSTDENGLTTLFSYSDSLGRLTETDFPDGGQTHISYNDTAPSPSITTSKKISSTQTLVSVSVSDGLGHPKQSQLTSDPQGTIFTDITYDGLGRVKSGSNPYRTGSDPTTSSGVTTYFYDALGRKCLEVPPGGTLPTGSVCPAAQPANTIFTTYSGNCTTVTDQTGKSRKSCSDALGRLTQVFEDPAGLNYATNYNYDALNNLISVVQNGSHQRTFTYDSLSHLLTSTNPEVGAITYTYDPNGNVATKKDARNITVTYGYDALNREISRTYSNGDPTVTTHYDESNCLTLTACQNIGHRTSMADGAGTDAWAYQVDAANSRTIHKEQRTTSGVTKSSTYYLDLAGNVTQAIYPTGRTVNYAFDAANRPKTAIDASNGITYATGFQTPPTGCLFGAVCYTPQGAFYALSIGQTSTFTGLNLTHTYNSRLQPNEFKASSSGGNAIDVSYNFVDPVTMHNAGHVYGITNNLDSTRSQTFAYDQLNRIASAQTTSTFATSPAHCWAETYNLDAWANLNSIAATNNSAYTGCSQESGFSTTADANNHLPLWGYDASGNATSDGFVTNYQWDGESQLKSANGVNYLYDGDGHRVAKVGSKLYWYGSGGDILAETDSSGNTTAEYIFFGGKRIAMLPASGNPTYYIEDLLGTSRVLTTSTGVPCYDADFYPYGGERAYLNTCPQNYKFEGKERDSETGNDDFGARYYSNRFGRWLSADWSAVPAPVPYANLTNPQTLNLYSMVADDPESFADLDGHTFCQMYQIANPSAIWDPLGATSMTDDSGLTQDEFNLMRAAALQQALSRGSISFSVRVENVGGEANPKGPVNLSSGTVFALEVQYKSDLPSGSTVAVNLSIKDSHGKVIGGSEFMFSIEPKAEISTKLGSQTVSALANTFEVKGIVFARGGAFKPTSEARFEVNLTDRAARREGSHSVSANLRGEREQIDRREAAKLWGGSREFLVP